MRDEVTFTAEEAVKVQRELRRQLGFEAETFPLPAFIGMISDEIEQMRAAGFADEQIAHVIEVLTGKRVSVDAMRQHYASPEQRHRGE